MVKKWISLLLKPSPVWSIAALLAVGIIIGITGLVAFDITMKATSTEAFCSSSCHEMKTFVTPEYTGTAHDTNHSGVRADCADCHVPKQFIPKMIRKTVALKEIYHHLLGTIDSAEKFEAHRARLAQNVWDYMEATDSQECRNCHNASKMDATAQAKKAAAFHRSAKKSGKTCINCHKGIAHKLPEA